MRRRLLIEPCRIVGVRGVVLLVAGVARLLHDRGAGADRLADAVVHAPGLTVGRELGEEPLVLVLKLPVDARHALRGAPQLFMVDVKLVAHRSSRTGPRNQSSGRMPAMNSVI